MRMLIVFLLGATLALAREGPLEAKGLQASVFAGDGNLLRKFTADSATGPLSSPLVRKGKVTFFDKDSANLIAAVVEWDEAVYRQAGEVVVGDGVIRLTTEDGTISARGFQGDLKGGKLDLRSDVEFVSETLRIVGSEANVEFEAEGRRRKNVLRKAVITGRIVAYTTGKDAPFERAESTHARFDADENMVYLKCPVIAWHGEERTVIDLASGYFEFSLKPTEPPLPAPVSNMQNDKENRR